MYKSRYLERIKAREANKPPEKVDVPILANPDVLEALRSPACLSSATIAPWPYADSTASYYMPRRERG